MDPTSEQPRIDPGENEDGNVQFAAVVPQLKERIRAALRLRHENSFQADAEMASILKLCSADAFQFRRPVSAWNRAIESLNKVNAFVKPRPKASMRNHFGIVKYRVKTRVKQMLARLGLYEVLPGSEAAIGSKESQNIATRSLKLSLKDTGRRALVFARCCLETLFVSRQTRLNGEFAVCLEQLSTAMRLVEQEHSRNLQTLQTLLRYTLQVVERHDDQLGKTAGERPSVLPIEDNGPMPQAKVA